ncbi:hypothetical protein A8144_07400 [Mycobacterium leprae 3125609]|nr:hypothetical protein A8144_07400 [Mycobacterium leprae 3125609]OAX71103.1 hypothetical protein A3216_07980 [Mycobacterium leprae 7935681]
MWLWAGWATNTIDDSVGEGRNHRCHPQNQDENAAAGRPIGGQSQDSWLLVYDTYADHDITDSPAGFVKWAQYQHPREQRHMHLIDRSHAGRAQAAASQIGSCPDRYGSTTQA